MLILHHLPMSPFGDKIIRILNYKQLEFELREYPPASRGIRQFSPTGKLPVLQIDDVWICDSTDIAYALEKQFPKRPILPVEAGQRALVHVLEDWADESLYFYEMHLRFGLPENSRVNAARMMANNHGLAKWLLLKVFPGAVRSITRKQGIGRKSEAQLITDLKRHINAVDSLLEANGWLVGDQLSLADISVYVMLKCFQDSVQGRGCLAESARISDWMQRIECETS